MVSLVFRKTFYEVSHWYIESNEEMTTGELTTDCLTQPEQATGQPTATRKDSASAALASLPRGVRPGGCTKQDASCHSQEDSYVSLKVPTDWKAELINKNDKNNSNKCKVLLSLNKKRSSRRRREPVQRQVLAQHEFTVW